MGSDLYLEKLDEDIAHGQAALMFSSPGGSERANQLNSLASLFLQRFWHCNSVSDLQYAAQSHSAAVQLLLRSHGHRSTCISGHVIQLLSYVKGERTNEKPRSLMDLADQARERYRRRGHPDDLETAIRLRKRLLCVVPPSNMFRPVIIDLVASDVNERYLRTESLMDLEEVVDLNRQALHSAPHDRSLSLQNLGTSLHTRFEIKRDTKDITEAIQVHREALSLRPAPHEWRDHTLMDLGDALKARFEQLGNYTDIDEAIHLYREALALRNPGHPERGRSLGKLGQTIRTRFKQSQNQDAIEEAVSLLRQARALHSPVPS
ncbi:hypothetical protein MVEN_01983000 [Mycena venus]|uniref:TPR-like protein n=1 Tax=Mycena venus TaxID=2733690 RepID=A0A8H6XEF4_9AGAR|nr:hypothetical protein MVEN_01983000 [Mycena venus]